MQCLLKELLERTEFQKAGLFFQRKCPNVPINMDSVFDEVTYLQQVWITELLND